MRAAVAARGARGPYAQGVLRREEIVRAALETFASNGFYGTSMRAVATEVGISHVGLAHHFKTKEELLTAVLQHRDELTFAGLAHLDGAPLEEVLVAVLRNNQQDPSLRRLFATLATEACDPAHPLHEHFVARYARVREQFAQMPEVVRAAAGLPAPMEPTLLSGTLLAVLDGLQLQWLLDPGFDEVRALRRFLAAFLSAAPSSAVPGPD